MMNDWNTNEITGHGRSGQPNDGWSPMFPRLSRFARQVRAWFRSR